MVLRQKFLAVQWFISRAEKWNFFVLPRWGSGAITSNRISALKSGRESHIHVKFGGNKYCPQYVRNC